VRPSRLAALIAAATILGPISIAAAEDAPQAVTIEVSAVPRTLGIRTLATIAADGTISADGTVSGDPIFAVQLGDDLDSITQGKPGFTGGRINSLTSLRLENPSGQGDARVSVEHVGTVGEAEGDDTALGGFRITVRVETDGGGLWQRPVVGGSVLAAVSLTDGASGDILTDIQEFTGVRGAQLRVTLFHTSGDPVPTGPVAITRTHRYVIADDAG
jgi:hypothetical protein